MNLNKMLRSLFGDKASRDNKLIRPFVEKVKAVYPDMQKLSNDELRQRTKQIQQQVQSSANKQKEEIDRLKATIEDTPIDERADIFAQIDKLEKEVLDIYEKALDEVLPEVFLNEQFSKSHSSISPAGAKGPFFELMFTNDVLSTKTLDLCPAPMQ